MHEGKKQHFIELLLRSLSDLCKTLKFILIIIFLLSMILDIELYSTFPLRGFELVAAACIALIFEWLFKFQSVRYKQ